MKRSLTVCCLVLALFIIGSAQKTGGAAVSNFAGTWELDLGKSTLAQSRGPKITAQTLTITQDAKTIGVAADTKTDGDMVIPVSNRTYNLDGSESTGELKMMQMTAPAKLLAKVLDGGKLELNVSATIDGPMGTMDIKQKDTFELADGGKVLKVHRSRTTPRGSEESDLVFNKK
ncbi:MAG: hypothetical protein ABIP75_00815 [Pyrinomonadaceae bacterium]